MQNHLLSRNSVTYEPHSAEDSTSSKDWVRTHHVVTPFTIMMDSLATCCENGTVESVQSLLSSLPLDEADYQPYRRFSSERYTRNLILRTSQLEVLLLCWLPGQCSPIHNHAGSRCWVRVLEGVATEIVLRQEENAACLLPSTISTVKKGNLTYSEDEDSHSICNFHSSPLVTLHVYSPPLVNMEVTPYEQSFIQCLAQAYS